MQQDQLRETATPVSALDALFDSIAATSDCITLLCYYFLHVGHDHEDAPWRWQWTE
jgi:hypothetical protein